MGCGASSNKAGVANASWEDRINGGFEQVREKLAGAADSSGLNDIIDKVAAKTEILANKAGSKITNYAANSRFSALRSWKAGMDKKEGELRLANATGDFICGARVQQEDTLKKAMGMQPNSRLFQGTSLNAVGAVQCTVPFELGLANSKSLDLLVTDPGEYNALLSLGFSYSNCPLNSHAGHATSTLAWHVQTNTLYAGSDVAVASSTPPFLQGPLAIKVGDRIRGTLAFNEKELTASFLYNGVLACSLRLDASNGFSDPQWRLPVFNAVVGLSGHVAVLVRKAATERELDACDELPNYSASLVDQEQQAAQAQALKEEWIAQAAEAEAQRLALVEAAANKLREERLAAEQAAAKAKEEAMKQELAAMEGAKKAAAEAELLAFQKQEQARQEAERRAAEAWEEQKRIALEEAARAQAEEARLKREASELAARLEAERRMQQEKAKKEQEEAARKARLVAEAAAAAAQAEALRQQVLAMEGAKKQQAEAELAALRAAELARAEAERVTQMALEEEKRKRVEAERAMAAAQAEAEALRMRPLASESQVLQEGVVLETLGWANGRGDVCKVWTCKNTKEFPLVLTLDFTGSQAFDVGGELTQRSVVQPYETKQVGTGRSTVTTDKMKCVLKLVPSVVVQRPDQDKLKAAQQAADAAMAAELAKMAALVPSPAATTGGGGGGEGKMKKDEAEVEAVLTLCRTKKTTFIDPLFPPVTNSAVHPPDISNPYLKTLQWRRPGQFMQSVSLFEDGISPTDIQQGSLGNCWFLCALSALAEFSPLVQKIFVNPVCNKEGAYGLRICVAGEWKTFILDDMIPCYPSQGPLFSCNSGNELWVLLVEKAYARINHSYHGLRSGNPSDALSDLTGFPVDDFYLDSEEVKILVENGQFWRKLLQLGTEECLMAAGTHGEDKYTESGMDPENEAGIVPGHAYTIVSVVEVDGIQLLQLRNPWGRFEWKGDYCDGSKLWTKSLLAQIRPVFSDADGMFWMTFKDFLRFFGSVNVCYVHAPNGVEWAEARASSITFSSAPTVKEDGARLASANFLLTVTTPTHCFFGAHQQDTRIPGTPAYFDVGVMVCKEGEGGEGGKTEVVCNTGLACARAVFEPCLLQPGVYRVIPYTGGCQLQGTGAKTRSINFSLHAGSKAVADSFTAVSGTDAAAIAAFNGARVAEFESKGEKNEFAPGGNILSLTNGSSFNYAISLSPVFKRAMEITLDFSSSSNCVAGLHGGQMKVVKKVAPGQTIVFQCLGPQDSSQGYGAGYSFSGKYA